jgi:hypothetical protein
MVYLPDAELTEEEVILVNAASESKEAEQTIQKAALVLKMREGIGSLARILKTIEVSSRMLATARVSHLCHLPRWTRLSFKATDRELYSNFLWLLRLSYSNTVPLTDTRKHSYIRWLSSGMLRHVYLISCRS